MLNAKAVGIWTDPQMGGRLDEKDAINCGHCNKNVFVKPGSATTVYMIQHLDPVTGHIWWTEEDGAGCRCCMRPVCLPCHDKGTCTPLEAFLEQMETGKPRLVQV